MQLALAISECQVGTVRQGEHTHSRPSRALHPTNKTCIPYPEETLRNGQDNCV